MVNSWGTSFGNSGKVWIPYRMLATSSGIWESSLYGMKTKQELDFKPLLTYKIVMSHDRRSQIRIRAGYANSATATAPTGTPMTFSKAFNYSGGSYPMQGVNSNPIEIARRFEIRAEIDKQRSFALFAYRLQGRRRQGGEFFGARLHGRRNPR
jgi:hypothetical protein